MDIDTTNDNQQRRNAIEAIAARRLSLQKAQNQVSEASAAYRDAVAYLRSITPSERATARQLGLSQTALRDLLRPVRRTGR